MTTKVDETLVTNGGNGGHDEKENKKKRRGKARQTGKNPHRLSIHRKNPNKLHGYRHRP